MCAPPRMTGRCASPRLQTVRTFFKRVIRATRYAATDRRIPKPLRLFAALGLLPAPGPFDEIVLLLAAIPFGLFYREPLADAWRRSGAPTAS
jgi:hypothetical protein